METALADLVDNAVDAAASEVIIRFVQREGRLRSLYVVDNGKGIDRGQIDSAMTVGGRRDYGASSLGKFGLGMKAASFSQARSLTVLSRTNGGEPLGRRWRLGGMTDFRCDVVLGAFAGEELNRPWGFEQPGTGSRTVIRWDEVTGFTATDEVTRLQGFISATINTILNHLGLVFHRFIADGRLRVALDVEDIDGGVVSPAFEVSSLDPFGYGRPGHPDYPKPLVARHERGQVSFGCHIWPGRSKLPEFRLPGGVLERQGLYFYRAERLLHAGGWDGITAPDARLQLARVAVEIDDDIAGLFQMNPEKSRVSVGPEFARLVEAARAADGTSVTDYLREAESVFRRSRQRGRNRKSMLPPGKGFEPAVRRVIHDEVPFLAGEQAVHIRWRRFDGTDLFIVDRDARTLWLNDRYRHAVRGAGHGGINDAPLFKALLYLLMEDVFEGEYLGPKDKDDIALWQEVLTVAARSQMARGESA
ncbi:MAG TPA: ATP-binding protein [Micromonosporaceae bacterium]|nr:ATP-binding protein [Micromonosporaceae bacterium]